MSESGVDRWRSAALRIWVIIGGAIVAWGVWRVFRQPIAIILPPLAIAGAVVYLLNPVVRALHKRGVPRSLGTAGSYAVLIGLFSLVVALVGPLLADQVASLVDNFPQILASLQNTIDPLLARLGLENSIDLTTDSTNASITETIRTFLEANREQLTGFVRGAGEFATALFHLGLTLILAPILAFYILVDLPRITAGMRRIIPPGGRTEVLELTSRIGATVGAYFRGQLLVATFVAVATSIGLAIVGLPFWAIVGIFTGVFNMVPLIGPFVGGVIGGTIALTVGDGLTQAIAVLIVMLVVQQIDNHVITPNIVSRTVKVHPATVILGLLVAGTMFGIVGMIVVIPTIAAIKLLVLHLLVTRVPAMAHLAADGPGIFGADLPGLSLEDFKPRAIRERLERDEDPPLVERVRRRIVADEPKKSGPSKAKSKAKTKSKPKKPAS